jgi:hypothetical protein
MIFRVAVTEPMPRLVVGYTELGCSKLKKGKGFLKPNFELGPSRLARTGQQDYELVMLRPHLYPVCFSSACYTGSSHPDMSGDR